MQWFGCVRLTCLFLLQNLNISLALWHPQNIYRIWIHVSLQPSVVDVLTTTTHTHTIPILSIPFSQKGGVSPTKNQKVKVQKILYPVSYTHLRAHETVLDLVCRL